MTYPKQTSSVVATKAGQHHGHVFGRDAVACRVSLAPGANERNSLLLLAEAAIGELNVSFLQFDDSALVRGLWDPTLASCVGDCTRGVLGKREVVSFGGGANTFVLVSVARAFLGALPNALEIPLNFVLYCRYIVIYVFVVLIAVVAAASDYIVASAGRVEGMNVLGINRVAGLVWADRLRLSVRGVVAITLLSTADLQLRQYGPLGHVTALEFKWYKQYTAPATAAASAAVWLVATVLSFTRPVVYSATVVRTCSMPLVDFQIHCDAGTVFVGDSTRSGQLVVLSCGAVAVCYVSERPSAGATPRPPPPHVAAPLDDREPLFQSGQVDV
ncbi:Aste57867_9157 [Aphanomyces stellatus]|uniref:Aste57867_9157 protein n=1 Tax=Aphanomyces stellatus TaxID=120398 RepID=A0A485KMI8_9STRA|nr:hypothetical protein As57867_009121 [Aphanomyces stellatus]VFT86041.1 Aste57867_9157 [Aphanomyces stellatus]